MRLLQLMMHEVNPYASFYRQGIEVMREQGHNDVRMIIRSEGTPDSRRYNKPTVPEVVVIIPGVDHGEEAASRDIVCTRVQEVLVAKLRYTALMMLCIMLFTFP